MKTSRVIFFVVLMIFLLPACAKNPIDQGDKVGDFLITSRNIDEVTFMYELDSSNAPSNETEVDIPWGTKIICTYGFFDPNESLDEVWSKKTYTLEINGRPVNLESFGTIDKEHPVVGTMRFYNVVIEAAKPGKLTVHHVGNTGTMDFDDTLTLIFLPSEE
jgi:hypothetical protein